MNKNKKETIYNLSKTGRQKRYVFMFAGISLASLIGIVYLVFALSNHGSHYASSLPTGAETSQPSDANDAGHSMVGMGDMQNMNDMSNMHGSMGQDDMPNMYREV